MGYIRVYLHLGSRPGEEKLQVLGMKQAICPRVVWDWQNIQSRAWHLLSTICGNGRH